MTSGVSTACLGGRGCDHAQQHRGNRYTAEVQHESPRLQAPQLDLLAHRNDSRTERSLPRENESDGVGTRSKEGGGGPLAITRIFRWSYQH
jgi:hypothetical protein